MSSQNVLAAQQWLNATYGSHSDYIHVTEDGNFGNANSYALVSAIQIELGISPATGTFGPATMTACNNNPIATPSSGNKVRILQWGLFCKGYIPGTDPNNPLDVTGTYDFDTINAVEAIQQDAGLQGSQVSDTVYGMQMKAILGVDWYVLSQVGSGGDATIRQMQQYLNHMYINYLLSDNNNNRGLIPADGVRQAINTTALIFGFQAEEGLPTSVANGNFGPTTQAHAPNIPYSGTPLNYYGSAYDSANITRFIILSQYMLYLNGFDPNSFGGAWDTATKTEIVNFQSFVKLPGQEAIGLNEWMSLLISTGNPSRTVNEGVKAFDCATRLTESTATALFAAGYEHVGRYLTGGVISNNQLVAKNLIRPEMKIIFDSGLHLFLIFEDAKQYYIDHPLENDIRNYFTSAQGHDDAEKAFSVARSLGVPFSEIIYFAVDYDFMASEVTSKIIPYFHAIHDYAAAYESIDPSQQTYRVGIYAARNTCTLVANAGYSISSFVSGMSTGWSGNAGFPLPQDWAFDQIQETTTAGIPIDRNVYSGKYSGFTGFINTTLDDQAWDWIRRNGGARVRVCASGCGGNLPVYWSKILVDDGQGHGHFELKYPTYDSANPDTIAEQAYYTMRFSNSNYIGSLIDPDQIRYVYYRRPDGTINAGYVKLIQDTGEQADTDNILNDFRELSVYRGPSIPGGVETVHEECSEWILTRPLKYREPIYGHLQSPDLPTGTIIDIPSGSTTGMSYPISVQVYQKMLPGSTTWEGLVPGQTYGFVDLDLENGVLPVDRTLITGDEL